MKTFKIIGLFVILFFIAICGKSQLDSSKTVIKDSYRLDGNKVYFINAETVSINGEIYAGTEFQSKPPQYDLKSSEMIKWMNEYREYHKMNIAIGRINYFITKNNIHPDKVTKYSFEFYGYYADFQYVFIKNRKSYSLLQAPLQWNYMKIDEVSTGRDKWEH